MTVIAETDEKYWLNCYGLWDTITVKHKDRYDGDKISIYQTATKSQIPALFFFVAFVASDPNSFLWVIIGAGTGCAQNTQRRSGGLLPIQNSNINTNTNTNKLKYK